MKIALSCIVTAFARMTIGTKVLGHQADYFMELLEQAIGAFDMPANGQGFIPMAPEACETVSCGVGVRTENEKDYIARLHRGQVGLYLKRQDGVTGKLNALPANFVAAVVYTREAYNADPECTDPQPEDVTHVLVAVIASGGEPKPPVDAWRFASNLAGGNLSYGEEMSKADAVALAKEVVEYHGKYAVVAD